MRKKCIVCGAELYSKRKYVCHNMPSSAQNLLMDKDLELDKPVDLNLCECSGCGLVQFDGEPVPYYKDSTRAGERSKMMIELRQQQYTYLIDKYHLEGKKIIEIGAGKGGFLKTLKDMKAYNIQEYGVENNASFVEYARRQYGVNVQKGFLDSSDTKIIGAPFDAFLSFAYPARLTNPNAMLRAVYNNLTDDGIGLIMVPSFEHLCQPGGFYDITGDHIAYYSEETFKFLLNRNGFEVLEHGMKADVYIYAIVRKRKLLNFGEIWSDAKLIADKVNVFVNDQVKEGKTLGIWCAGHYAFTVLSVAGVGSKISYIIDNAKFKQGMYAPASHVPIVGPEYYVSHPVDMIVILGPIYVQEIVKEIREKCFKGVTIAIMNRDGIQVLMD